MTGQFKKGNNLIGKVKESFTYCNPWYEMYNETGNLKYIVTANCCQCGIACNWSFCGKCNEVEFSIFPVDQDTNIIENRSGTIKKIFSGYLQEMVNDSESFEIKFPKDADSKDKLMLIGVLLMIDYLFYENTQDNNSNKSFLR